MFTELNLVAQHQLVTSPAPPGGLLPVTVTGSGRPTPIITVPSQGTHKVLPKAGVTNFYETFVLYSTSVFQINGSAETPRLRQYPNRYASLFATCKTQAINPYDWIKDIPGRQGTITLKQLQELLPQNRPGKKDWHSNKGLIGGLRPRRLYLTNVILPLRLTLVPSIRVALSVYP